MLINMIKEDDIDLGALECVEEVQINPQHYILIGFRQKGMNKSDIGSVPSCYSKMFAISKHIIQKFTTESSIPTYVGNEGCLANLQDTSWRLAEWKNSLRIQHLHSVEDISNLLLKLLGGENILSIQPLKVIEFIDLYSSSIKSNITTVHEAVILKLLHVYESPIKENEKHCASLILSDSRLDMLEEWVNIYPYRSELLKHLIAYPTNLFEKSKGILNAIRSNVRKGGLRTCKITEYWKFFDIICLNLDCDIFSTNMHTLKQHWKTLYRSIIECFFCDMNNFEDLLRNINIGAHLLSNSYTAFNSIHHYQQINFSELRRKSNVHDQLIEFLSTTKHSECMALALKVLDTLKSFPIETDMKIIIDAIIKSVCQSEMCRSIIEIERGDFLLLTYLDKHIQLQQHDQWNILESIEQLLLLYTKNLCTSAIAKYIKSRDIIEIMMGTEINELSFDIHILKKHILLPILLQIQDKKEEKQILLQWINSCDAKYQSIINLSETALEQIIRMTNWSIFPQNLSLKVVLTNSKLKEQIFREFVDSNYNELVRTSCHTHDKRICQAIVEKSYLTHEERICQEIVEKSCYEVNKNNKTLNMIEDITRQGYQSCLEFLEIVTCKTRDNSYKSFADTKENLHKSIANTMENLHKSFTDKRANLHKSFADTRENAHISFGDSKENLYMSFSDTKENVHISFGDYKENLYMSFGGTRENLHISCAETRENMYKGFADIRENLHISFDDTMENNLYPSFGDAWDSFHIRFADTSENLYKSLADSRENLHIRFADTRKNLHKSCADTWENLYISIGDRKENFHISYAKIMENLLKSFVDSWENLPTSFADTKENSYKSFVDSSENLPISFADTKENSYKSFVDSSENLPISFADTKENSYKSFVDSWESLPISFADTEENSYKSFVDSLENLHISFADTKENSYKSFDYARENLHKSFAKAIHEDIYLQLCKDKVLHWSCECCSYHHHNSTHKHLCLGKTFCIQIENSICHFENRNLSKKHFLCRCHENLCSGVTGNIHLHHKNEGKLFSLEEIAVSNSSKHIVFEDFQSEHIPFVKEGRVTECQLTLTERFNAVLGITFTVTQCIIAFLQNILQRNDCKKQETDCKQQETDCKQQETDCKQQETGCKQHKTDCKQQETGCKQHKTDCKQHETEEYVRKQTATNLSLVFGIISCNQILKNIGKEKENVNIQCPGKLQKWLSIHGNRKLENIIQKDKLMDLFDILQTDNSKCIKSELYNIINHNSIFRNDEITAYPVNGYNGMSNEILRVGSLNNFPSENSPSLIKLAKYGFYYEGKGREVTCFSCGIKHDDWSYRSNPLEVHRQISPYCEYLKTLTPRPPSEIIESDCRHNATPRMPTTEIPYQNGIGTDSIHTCTDAYGPQMTVAVQSVDSGLFGSSLSHRSNNLVTSNSTSISSISQRSSRASADSGFGSSGSHLSTDHSSSASHTSNLTVPQLPPLLEGGEHSIQRVSGPASRDSPVPQNNRKNTPKEKYPEYIPIERRRATYKNWPPNLDFLHPLDLSECGFFYSNFGDCVRCFHCGIGLRNWESDDNPWVEHARWSRKCPYLLQRKGQEFIDSVLSVLGLQTDSEIEMQTANAGTEPASQVSSGYGTASSNDVRDPISHPAAQYIIRENIFGDNKEKQVKKTMNQLLQNHEWDDITNDMLVNALLESKDIMENLDTKTNSLNLSESAVSKSPESSDSKTPSTGTDDKNKEEESKKSPEENPEKIQKENEELKELYTCKICLDERVGITFVPCGHLVTCKTCSPKIRRCPLCRTFIRGTIKTTM